MDKDKKTKVFIFLGFLAVFVPLMVWVRFSGDDDAETTRTLRRKAFGEACRSNRDCTDRVCYMGSCSRACNTDADCYGRSCFEAELTVGSSSTKLRQNICMP